MIEGMNILKETEIMSDTLGNGWWVPTIIVAIIAFVLLCLLGVAIKKKSAEGEYFSLDELVAPAITCIIIVGCVFLGSLSHYEQEVPTGRYIYEVTFDSEEAFLEAYTEYDVVKINDTYEDIAGKIYTIKDKEK